MAADPDEEAQFLNGEQARGGYLLDISRKIDRYLRDLSPGILGVQSVESVQILKMTPGAYNLNYHVGINGKKVIFRVNVDQQSGLPHQIEYEFKALKFLEGHRIAPKPYHLDNSRERFDFGILIEECLEGPYLGLESEEMPEVADLLVRLHSLPPGDLPLIVWGDPLGDTYEQARRDLVEYEAKETPEEEIIRMAGELLTRSGPLIEKYRHLYRPDGVNHTDVVRDNIVKTSEGMRLIDWEKPRLDDCTYDLACFLCEPAQLWCTHLSHRVTSQEDRENFLEAYARQSGRDPDLLSERVRIREPLLALHWILWGATKLCDLRDRRTSPELVKAHEEKRVRYARIGNPGNIQKLLDSF